MDLNFSKIVNRERKQAEMLLYGEIGNGVDGHAFAQELNWLAREYDEIKIRINSEGGSVVEGLSIVSEMMASPAFIHAQVDGVAASMAAVLLPAADKVSINDYAKIMIHSPYYQDEKGAVVSKLSAKDKKALAVIKSTLSDLLVKRGMAAAEVATMMLTDTWLNADEALSHKLVDEINTTGRRREYATLDVKSIAAKVHSEVTNTEIKMKKVIATLITLGAVLNEGATEDQVAEAVAKLAKPAGAQLPDKLVAKLLEVGKVAGTVTEKNEASFKALAATNIDLFVDLLDFDNLGTAQAASKVQDGTRLSDVLAALKSKGKPAKEGDDEKDFEWYEKNAPQMLAKIEATDPEKFKKLKEADEAKYQQ